MELLHPGVYIREVPSGVNPIEGVSTSTAAFIGAAERGPLNKAVLVTSFTPEFDGTFGGSIPDSQLAVGAFHFFNNGGRKCYVVRVAGAGARPAEITIRDRNSNAKPTLVIRASSPGAWGNHLDVTVEDGLLDPANEFNLNVYRNRSNETPPMPSLPLESFGDLSMNPSAKNFVERVVNGRSKQIQVSVVTQPGSGGTGTSRSGALVIGNGAEALKLAGGTKTAGAGLKPGYLLSEPNPEVNPAADRRRFSISIDGEPSRDITVAPDATTGPHVAASIEASVRRLKAHDPAKQQAYSDFIAEYRAPTGGDPQLYLQSGSVGPGSSVAVTDAVETNAGASLLRIGQPLGVESAGTDAAGGAAATAGTSRSGANPSTDPPPESRKFDIDLDGDGPRTITIDPAGHDGTAIALSIEGQVQALAPNDNGHAAAYSGFAATYSPPAGGTAGFFLLTSGTTGANSRVVVTPFDGVAGQIRLPTGKKYFDIVVDGDGPHRVTLPGGEADGNAIAAAITNAVRAIGPNRTANKAAFTNFSAAYVNDGGLPPALVLSSGTTGQNSSVVVSDASVDNAAGLLSLGAAHSGVETDGSAILRPANSMAPTEYHLGVATAGATGNVHTAFAGDDGAPVSDFDLKGGLAALDPLRDVNIVAIPGAHSPDVVSFAVNYCARRGDCFYVADIDPDADDFQKAREYVDKITAKSSYGALYYPWLQTADPSGQSSQPVLAPPSGFVAGIYARIDSRRGVFKAPAGTETTISGVVGVAVETTDTHQDFLNPIGLNAIRRFPASGVVIWGARTLATRSDPEYRYIPVRRLAIFLEQSIYNGIQFAVFEPNDEPLWASLRLNIGAFMFTQFRSGAFQGKTASDAFFVRCDASTTTQQDIDLGRVNIVVGFAPLKPAEFVVLNLTQKSGEPVA